MAAFVDVCRFTAVSTGTVDFVVSSAVTGYQTPALAGAVNGAVYRYRAESSDLTQWEIGFGAYTSGSITLARTTVLYNSSGSGTGAGQSGAGTKISFTAAPQVAVVFLAEDFLATGNIPGTATNDSPSAGSIGEYKQSQNTLAARTVTISNASPAVVTDTGHGYTAAINNYSAVYLTTSGGLPTGLSINTNYYITIVDANTYKLSTTVANAIAGTFINTSSAGSGTHTAAYFAILVTANTADVAGISLTAGDWDLSASAYVQGVGSPSITYFETDISPTSVGLPSTTGAFFLMVPASPLTVIQGVAIPRYRVSLSGTSTYFLTVNAAFTGGTTVRSYGVISARRVR